MAEAATKLPVKTEKKPAEATSAMPAWWPVEGLRREIDRLFDDFGMGFRQSSFGRSLFAAEPFWRRDLSWTAAPAVDVTESDKAYEVTAELPGMDEKNIEVKVVNGNLTIKGEKQEEKEEKKRIIIYTNATSARSSAPSRYRMGSTPRRSRRASRRACSR